MSEAPRVLIVEDQYFVAVDCELQLRSVGIECVGLATTAAEALDIAEREHPDFVLMDIRLASVADGVEAAIVIYERLGIRCIFASAHADAGDPQACRARASARLARQAVHRRPAGRDGSRVSRHAATRRARSERAPPFSPAIH